MAEVYRMMELPRLYQTLYDQPLKLPKKVEHGLTVEGQQAEDVVSTRFPICNTGRCPNTFLIVLFLIKKTTILVIFSGKTTN